MTTLSLGFWVVRKASVADQSNLLDRELDRPTFATRYACDVEHKRILNVHAKSLREIWWIGRKICQSKQRSSNNNRCHIHDVGQGRGSGSFIVAEHCI